MAGSAAVLWVLVIFILCALPGEDMPDLHLNIPYLDKMAHFGMFLVLSLLIVFPFELYTSWSVRQIYIIAVLAVLGYGGLIEILQNYFFSRSGEMWDLVADVVGGVAGCLGYPLVKRMLRIKDRSVRLD